MRRLSLCSYCKCITCGESRERVSCFCTQKVSACHWIQNKFMTSRKSISNHWWWFLIEIFSCRRRNFGCTALYSQLSAVLLHSQEPTILLLSSFGKHERKHNIELKVHQHFIQILDSWDAQWMYQIQVCAAVPEPQILAGAHTLHVSNGDCKGVACMFHSKLPFTVLRKRAWRPTQQQKMTAGSRRERNIPLLYKFLLKIHHFQWKNGSGERW